jgi:hypothetical protein
VSGDAPAGDGDAGEEKLPRGPWYAEGLAFECTSCGKCCLNHGDGFSFVYSTRADRRAIAKQLGLSLKRFEAEYCEQAGGALSFKSKDNACIFLDGHKCTVYELRPAQCRTFPFWPEVLEDEDTWERDVASFCPGVGKGPVHDLNAIRAAMRASGA